MKDETRIKLPWIILLMVICLLLGVLAIKLILIEAKLKQSEPAEPLVFSPKVGDVRWKDGHLQYWDNKADEYYVPDDCQSIDCWIKGMWNYFYPWVDQDLNLEAQIDCLASGGHKLRFTLFDAAYIFDCSKCNHKVIKGDEDLTCSERKALEELGVIE